MPPAGRLLGPLEALPSRISGSRYVCTKCRSHFLPRTFQLTTVPGRRYKSDDNVPFTEKVRRRLWGTDNPPGLEDPYGGESFIEKNARARNEARQPQENGEPQPPAEEDPRQAAALEEEASAAAMSEYVPAKTIEGLEHVGTLGQWWDQPPSKTDRFFSFAQTEKVNNREDILMIMHQAMVELCIMKELNKPLEDVCAILAHEEEILARINQVEVKQASDPSKGLVLGFPNESTKTTLFEFFRDFDDNPGSVEENSAGNNSTSSPAAAAESKDAASSVEAGQSESTDFLSFPLASPTFKFAFFKRASQLTGHLIPDPEIASITTPSTLLEYMTKAAEPKPTKLAEQLIADGQFTALSNVKIFDRRQTPIDKEKEIGRWKIIEEELTKRGLPTIRRPRA